MSSETKRRVARTLCAAGVLHYACYSYESLWVRKGRGNDNYRLGGREDPPPLHARVCADARVHGARGGDAAARRVVRRFFEETVMLTDATEIQAQLRAGVCERIQAPKRLLARFSSSLSDSGVVAGR